MDDLDLSQLLESGEYSDLRLVTTNTDDGFETEHPIHRNIPALQNQVNGNDIAHLNYNSKALGTMLRYLYSGKYEVQYEVAIRRASEAGGDDRPHSMYWSIHAMQLAHEVDLFGLYMKAAWALCKAAKQLTNHVDFPDMVDELYETCGQHPGFPIHLASIARTIAYNCLISNRLKPTMLKYPQLALDVMEASLDALSETQKDLVEAQEKISDLRAQGCRADYFEFKIVHGSKKRSHSSSHSAVKYPALEGEI
ncbi:uncharacterized protein BDZ83DRAFT_741199 [Colletotrichum acutatum]|uniref:BTB domain-containing protein n=1 Tax=Glomerella acutata TaxID=27357 RepID=A0AAD8UMY3_GLOAC|nr:uncharacterized protein BDZ83DRAFT_741199 [Colletotrichum acutatum]KAK1724759.1 hypothetical protein BDZ83DRAFT_741199 [Colletotrichum acutatum]